MTADAATLDADALVPDDHSGFEPSPAADLDHREGWWRGADGLPDAPAGQSRHWT